MIIESGMKWPICDNKYLNWKMAEHSAWYSGDSEVLANFYNKYMAENFLNVPYPIRNQESFWSRQIKNQGEIFIHVPLAGDIAETSANFLFSEAPIIRIAEATGKNGSESYKKTQKDLDLMLMENGFFRKILESAETCAAIGGTFIKIAWDQELSPYPIPVIVQADRAIPEFKFGILTSVTFWKVLDEDTHNNKIIRLFETYEKGSIRYEVYDGTDQKIGKKLDLKSFKETEDLEEVVETPDELFAVYIPNILPNRLDRNSYLGRSDYSGIEGLMDALDEVYSDWIREIALSQAKILLPESFLQMDKSGSGRGKLRYNLDQSVYVRLDVDPTVEGPNITPNQFEIRADEYEKTSLNLLDRIVTAAGYSPQSFGLNIQGRAESGTALSMRERKSFSTKSKKENYWQPSLKRLVHLMMLIYNTIGGTMETDVNLNVAFSDSITNNLNEVSTSVKMLSDAMAASTETKVRLLHPDWEEEQILTEVDKIIEENQLGPAPDPGLNLDNFQLNNLKNKQ